MLNYKVASNRMSFQFEIDEETQNETVCRILGYIGIASFGEGWLTWTVCFPHAIFVSSLHPLIFVTTHWGRCYKYHPLSDKKPEAQHSKETAQRCQALEDTETMATSYFPHFSDRNRPRQKGYIQDYRRHSPSWWWRGWEQGCGVVATVSQQFEAEKTGHNRGWVVI